MAIAAQLFSHIAVHWVPIGPAGTRLSFVGAAAGSASDEQQSTGGTTTKQGKHHTGATEGSGHPAGAKNPEATRVPSFGWSLFTVLSPVVLMLPKAAADLWPDPNSALYKMRNIVGKPVVALLIAVLPAMVTFGTAVGFGTKALGKKIGESLLPIVGVMLIVGAGSGFKQVLVDGGTGLAIGKLAVALSLSALVLGWIVAVLIRVSTGSATVATVTAAGIAAPLAAGLPPAQLSLVVLSVGAGSLFFSHVNDAGFWLVKEYFGLTIRETTKTWSVV